MIRGIGVRALRVAGFLLGGLAVLAGWLVWRLSEGPLRIDFLTPVVQQALHDPKGRFEIKIGDTELTWNAPERSLAIRVLQVRAIGTDGTVVAAVPDLEIGVSVGALMRGRLAPVHFDVHGLRLHAIRTETGAFVFELADPTTEPGAGRQPPAATTGLTTDLLDALRRPPDPLNPLGALRSVRVVDAQLSVDDRKLGRSWRMPRADITLARDADGIVGSARLSLALGGRTTDAAAEIHYRSGDGTADTKLQLGGIEPADLILLVPDSAALATAVAMRFDATVAARLGAGFEPTRVQVALTGGPGTVTVPGLGPIAVAGLALEARADLETRRFELDRLALTTTAPATSITGRGSLDAGIAGAETASLQLDLTRGGRTGTVTVAASRAAGGGAGQAVVTLGSLEPALWADLAPALAPLAAAAFPIGGRIELGLNTGLAPQTVRFDLTAAPGTLVLPAFYPEPLALAKVSLRGRIDGPALPAPERLVLDGFQVDFGGPRVEIAGQVTRTGQRLAITGGVSAAAVPVDDLPRLWPKPVGRNARDWITKNLSVGTIDRAALKVVGTAPLDDPSEVLASTLDGTLSVRDLSVRYFGALPPVTGLSGEGTSDGRSLILKTSGGTLRDLALAPGRIEVSKLDTPQEWIEVDVPLSGPLGTALAVIDTPPLGYAAKFHIDPARVEGTGQIKVRFYFPLIKRLEVEDIVVTVSSVMRGLAIPEILPGVSVGGGDVKLDLDRKGMVIAGKARVNGVPAQLEWREAFADEAPVRTRIGLKGTVDAADLARSGIVVAPYLAGAIGADAVLTIDRNRANAVNLALDLKDSRLTLAELDWNKPPGVPAKAKLAGKFATGQPITVNSLSLSGGGLDAEGSLVLPAQADGLTRLTLTRFVLGKTNLQVEARPRAGGGTVVSLRGPSLDVRPLLKRHDGGKPEPAHAEPDPPGSPLELKLQVGRMIAGDGDKALNSVVAHLVRERDGWDRADFDAKLSGSGGGLSLRYGPDGNQRRLQVRSDDAGGILQALDLTGSVRGGQIRITGQGDLGGRGEPLVGRIEVENYRVVDASILARLLNALSVTGLIELLSGDGINFSRLVGDFRLANQILTLSKVATSGSALGLTMAGKIDLDRDTLDVEGTVVPVYGINRIIGMIPVLGDLLSGGSGEGIFAAAYYMTGPLNDPNVSVNPLSILAPGFLRNLFFLGGTDEGSPSTTPTAPAPPSERPVAPPG